MNRRYWPAALAILALLFFGSYLAYTQYLLNRIQAEARIHSEMYAQVQRGITAPDDSAQIIQTNTFFELQRLLISLGVPLVLTDRSGAVVGARNLPFDSTDSGKRDRYVARLRARGRMIESSYGGTVYYGYPPIVQWLRWVPWLQLGGALLLITIALAIVRSNVRAERERLWAAMARELAHQMGTPLSSLSGWIEVLRLPTEERNAMATEDRIGSVMGADVERLERVSRRFELIGKRPALEPISVADVVHELEDYFRPRLPRLAGGVDLQVRIRYGLPRIRGNVVLLAWALENIVKNAVDALAGRTGRILISARGDTESVHVRISDNGPGIAPHVRDRIFEPGVSTKSAGWGVGLSLTRRIIEELHGGRITVHDRSRGGTTFDIQLPADGKRLPRRFFESR
jgi:signal transduction histidine kinase